MKDKPRKYTIVIDGKSIEKTAEELPSEVVIACEKINNLMKLIKKIIFVFSLNYFLLH